MGKSKKTTEKKNKKRFEGEEELQHDKDLIDVMDNDICVDVTDVDTVDKKTVDKKKKKSGGGATTTESGSGARKIVEFTTRDGKHVKFERGGMSKETIARRKMRNKIRTYLKTNPNIVEQLPYKLCFRVKKK